jgi:antitoxin component YwqK of YwqJK toxin-antitoxin module
VYRSETRIGCARPSGTAGGVPAAHGLNLDFYMSTGKLKSQGFYEDGLLRWSIEYHATGKRSLVATFDDVEPRVHRENGVRTSYAANGTVTSQAEYRSGVLNGWQKLWEDDGHPIVATRHENGRAVEQVLPDGTSRKP